SLIRRDRRWDGDDDDVALACSASCVDGGRELAKTDESSHTLVEIQVGKVTAPRVDDVDFLLSPVDSDHAEPVLSKVDCRRESDIAQPYDCDARRFARNLIAYFHSQTTSRSLEARPRNCCAAHTQTLAPLQ